jgi:hypothetical protein
MFPTIDFCAKQILGIVRSQIEIEKIFISWNLYYYLEMLFTIKKCGQIDLCQQKLTQ